MFDHLEVRFPMRHYKLIALVSLLCLGASAYRASAQALAEEPLPRVAPTPPHRAADTFVSGEGFRVDLLAAEPLVRDPVAIQYDADGHAFVAEMFDYPYTDPALDQAWSDQKSPPAGRIRKLFDDDGDGKFDRSVVFADRISWPTGIAFWRDGVYVAATPDLWYFRDTDGDGRADERRRVFTGFRKYNVQAVMNNLQWGVDHYIYGAGGTNGGTITAPGRPHVKPVVLGRHDFRFDPRKEILEIVPGGARFGNTMNPWGDRFICNIRNPLQFCLFPLRIGPVEVPASRAIVDAAEAGDSLRVFRVSPPEPWRVLNARRLAADRSRWSPRSERVPTGYVTSSSGVTIYRGGAYPDSYVGDAFVGEPAANLVMHYRVQRDGLSYAAQHIVDAQNREFLASSDNWCRPVNFVNAPDGTLHFVDMYRETIEHPWSIPDDIKARVDLLSGRDRGRIYRLLPARQKAGFQPPPPPHLSDAKTRELVELLASPVAWWRETAQRLLWERRDPQAVAMLRADLSRSTSALQQFYCLTTLAQLAEVTSQDIEVACRNPHPQLRRLAVRLAAEQVNGEMRNGPYVLRATRDEDITVRCAAVIALSQRKDETVTAALADVARRDGAQEDMRFAVVAASYGREVAMIKNLLPLHDPSQSLAVGAVVDDLLQNLAARKDDRTLVSIAEILAAPKAGNFVPDRVRWRWAAHLARVLTQESPAPGPQSAARAWFAKLSASAAANARERERASADRVAAIALLKFTPQHRDVLVAALNPDEPLAVQHAALQALHAQGEAMPPLVVPRLASWSQAMQSDAIAIMLTREDWARALLEAIDAGELRPEIMPLRHRPRLLNSRDEEVRALAKKLLGGRQNQDRAAVIRRYQAALKLRGDKSRGARLFQKECQGCHRLRGAGTPIGPDLDSVLHRTDAELLTQILDPDREVALEFQRYVALTKAGTVHTGVLRDETDATITLVDADNRSEIIRREDIEQLKADGHSLMPTGLEEKLSLQQMADLLSFLKLTPKVDLQRQGEHE